MTRSTPADPRVADGRWPLVGRDADRERLLRWFDGAGSRIALLSGAPGVGTSRLLADVAESLPAEGWAVSPITGTSIMSAVPLGALTPLFAGGRAEFDAAAADPATLFRRAAEVARAVAGDRRLLLAVDDLSLLDTVSATLIAQLVASGTASLAASIRTGDPLPDPIVAIWSADRALRLEVAPLTVAEVETLLGAVLGPVAHRTAAELHAATGGNPLYVRELVIGALDANRLVERAGVWQLIGEPVATPALRELILARVRTLDDAERDALERLAVCGELAVDDLREPGARAALGRLEHAGIVEFGSGARGITARLIHPQYGAAVADSLSRLRASDVLLEQADVLENARGGASDDLRIATWRLEAGRATDPDLLAGAARLARQTADHSTVERLTAAAIDVAGPRPDLLLLRGEALLRLGRAADALEVLGRASLDAAPPELVTALAATTAMAHASIHDGLDAGLAIVESAERTLPAVDPGLVLTRALIEQFQNRIADAEALIESLAPALGDSPAAAAIIASARAQPLAALGREDDALRDARVAFEFAQATGGSAVPGLTVANTLLTLGTVELHVGRYTDAHAHVTAALLESLVADDEIVARSAEFLLARIEWERGDLGAAERWNRDTMSGALTLGPASLHVPAAAGLAIALVTRGDVAAAREALSVIPEPADHIPGAVIARAWIAALDGDGAQARAGLLAAADRFGATGHHYLESVMLFHLARLGYATDALPGFRRLVEVTDSSLVALQRRQVEADVANDRRELAAVAEEWLDRGSWLFAAEAFATAARAARRTEEHRVAVSLQASAEEHARQTGGAMTPLLRFSDELSPLTRREREIAALAAQGMSSKDIADRLFLSTRTVDNHLQSIYGKLGIRGRHELPGALAG